MACCSLFRIRSLELLHSRIRNRSLDQPHMAIRNRSLDLLHNRRRRLIHSRSSVRSANPSIHILLQIHIRSLGLQRNQCHSKCYHIRRLSGQACGPTIPQRSLVCKG